MHSNLCTHTDNIPAVFLNSSLFYINASHFSFGIENGLKLSIQSSTVTEIFISHTHGQEKSSCKSVGSELICTTTKESRNTAMDKDYVIYQLMDMRMNGILNRILEKDKEYQKIARKSFEYIDSLETKDLPQEARSLIDLLSCEQNALGARYGALACLLGFSDCVELMAKPLHLSDASKKTD